LRNGRPASPVEPVDTRSELERLRSACRRQAHVIELLSAARSTLRTGAAALRAENAKLRAADDRVRSLGGAGARPRGDVGAGEALEVSLPLDTRAPGAARIEVDGLRGRVPSSVLASARLVVSELVTNSVLNRGASAGGVVVVRVELAGTMVRLEVRDPGCGGMLVPRAPDREGGGGFGLNAVQTLSERWGLERVGAGGTRVWAQLPARPSTAPEPTAASGSGRGREMLSRRQARQRRASDDQTPATGRERRDP